MTGPPVPSNETSRLHELHSASLVTTAADPDFSAFTELAAHLCSTPMSFISLVDAEQVWLRSPIGVDVSHVARKSSFCGYVVADGHVLEVEDASRDPRFAHTPLVTGPPHLRFYLGIPLSSANGIHWGALCVADHVPRRLTADQLRAMQHLATAAVTQILLHKSALQRQKLHDALNRSNDDLTTFIRAASHDLKGPLRSIMIMSEALRRGSAQTDEEKQELLEAIHGAATRGHRLIADLLQHTNVHLVHQDVEVDLERVLVEVREELAALCQQHQALVETQGLPRVHGNPAVWHVILKTLVENGIKYTPLDRRAQVQVDADLVDDKLELRVHDQGCGIEPKYVDRIFKPLERLHAGDIPGSGIGLATVKRLVTELGGTIEVSARQPFGSTFCVVVPCTVPADDPTENHQLPDFLRS